jgi:hypothetical protein
MQETSVPTLDEIRRELGLTVKQMDFALAYVGKAKFNATKAAEIAGYDGDYNSLGVIGHENLKNVKIIEYIRKLTERRLHDKGYSSDRVTNELLDVAFLDTAEFFTVDDEGYIKLKCDLSELPTNAIEGIDVKTQKTIYKGSGETKTEIQSWITKIKFHNKEWALTMLSKLLDMESGEQMGKKTRQTFADWIKEETLARRGS